MNRHTPFSIVIANEMRLATDPGTTSLTIRDQTDAFGHRLESSAFTAAAFYIESTGLHHFGLIRPKSVRTWHRSARFESSTTGPRGPRQNTTQCQHARPPSSCHLIASNARAGRASHDVNGTSVRADRNPLSSLRTWSVSDHSRRACDGRGKEVEVFVAFEGTNCLDAYFTYNTPGRSFKSASPVTT
jgi:hypothetical protein